jgi:two-component system NarL family sensor kinase
MLPMASVRSNPAAPTRPDPRHEQPERFRLVSPSESRVSVHTRRMRTTHQPVPIRRMSAVGLLGRFALSGLIGLVVLAALASLLVRHISTSDAIDDARRLAVVSSRAVLPELTPALTQGDRAALRSVDDAVRRQVLIEPIVRVKVWDASGRIVYSDEGRLIGDSYTLGADELHAMKERTAEAEVSNLDQPENRFERQHGKLLEVYQGVRSTSGQPLLFEAYVKFSAISANGRHAWLTVLPALLVALVVLQLLQLPLAWRLLTRVRFAQQERETLLRRSLEASDVERRRIAANLHDGIIQTLASVHFSVAAVAQRLRAPTHAASRQDLRQAAEATRQGIAELRSLVVDIYPPSLTDAGLSSALEDLVATARERGLDATLTADGLPPLDQELEAVLYRVAQEGVRNVIKHARAPHLWVTAAATDTRVTLTVADDGIGFPAAAAAPGHVGLRLVADMVSDHGGTLWQGARDLGGGAVLRVEVPRA